MKNISIALVETLYSINAGYVARIMANFGFNNLYLINPLFDFKRARKFASHGEQILENAIICNFKDLENKFNYLIGTSAITGSKLTSVYRSVVTPEEIPKKLKYISQSVCFIFGRDTIGLRKEEIDICDLIVHIPTGTDYPTLNISHAMAIILNEISKERCTKNYLIAERSDRDRVIEYAERIAHLANFPSHKIPLLKLAIKQIMSRAGLRSREYTLFMGLLNKIILNLEPQE